ncbi:MAG: hypothetical protein ABSF64_09290 [Bryobacteraceae bacterium]
MNFPTPPKIFVTLPLLLAGVLSLPAVAPADEFPLNKLQRNGSAILNNFGHITLTTNLNEAGSAFIFKPYQFGPTGKFFVSFVYHAQPYSTSPPADGLALIVENTGSGPAYIGLAGSGLGFFTQTAIPAIAVTLDYYSNEITGSPAGTLAIASPAGVDLAQIIPAIPVFGGSGNAGMRYVWVAYSNATNVMAIYYSDTSTRPATPTLEMTLPQDISSLCDGQIYLGFSGGTGALDSIQSLDFLGVDVSNDDQ